MGAFAFAYPGERDGAFLFVLFLGVVNALSIWPVAQFVVVRSADGWEGLGPPIARTENVRSIPFRRT